MKITVSQSPQKYITHIRNRLDSPLMFGQERFTGWCLGNFFAVKYFSGKEFGRRNYPISNKAVGFARKQTNGAVILYCNFKGLTDPVSLTVLFLLTLLIFILIGTPMPMLFSLGWTVAVALLTALCTICTSEGRNGAAQLDAFLIKNEQNFSD